MISDVLSEAVQDINRYLEDPVFAGAYSGAMTRRIKACVSEMEAILRALDTQPDDPESTS